MSDQAAVLAALRDAINAIDGGAAGPDPSGRGATTGTAGTTTDTASQAAPSPAVASATAFLVRSASRRPITIAEARQKLLARDHDDEVVDAAVARSIGMRILDDEAFATAWVDDRGCKRGYGRDRLERELRRRRIDPDIIGRALARLDERDEVQNATRLARKRAQAMPADLEPAAVAQRLVGMLVRRGYTSDLAHRVARSVTAMERDWD